MSNGKLVFQKGFELPLISCNRNYVFLTKLKKTLDSLSMNILLFCPERLEGTGEKGIRNVDGLEKKMDREDDWRAEGRQKLNVLRIENDQNWELIVK